MIYITDLNQMIYDLNQSTLFIEPTVYRTDGLSNRRFIEPTVYRTDSLSNRQFVEPTVCRTDSLSNRQYVEPTVSAFWMDTCDAFIELYYTHQKRFKYTHAKSLSNFIKPNNSVLNAHTQLFYQILLNPISPAFWITYAMSSTNFIEPNTSVLKCTNTLNLLNSIQAF